MSLPKFFVENLPQNGEITISEADARHLLVVLRGQPGEIITVCDGKGLEAECELVSTDGKKAAARIINILKSTGELGTTVDLYPSLSRGERFEWMLAKAVELGAASITPILSARCVATAPDAKKLERWQKLSREAAMQSKRAIVPEVKPCARFAEALAAARGAKVFCYEEETRLLLSAYLRAGIPGAISVMTGPEGGYEPNEARLAQQHGWALVSLGGRVLRCETAPAAVLAAIMALSGEM